MSFFIEKNDGTIKMVPSKNQPHITAYITWVFKMGTPSGISPYVKKTPTGKVFNKQLRGMEPTIPRGPRFPSTFLVPPSEHPSGISRPTQATRVAVVSPAGPKGEFSEKNTWPFF